MMINRSKYLVIVIATYNRLRLLKKTIKSLNQGVKSEHDIVVVDGGSTDGTINYLKSNKKLIPVFQGKLIGTSRAYNRAWRKIRCKYTVWLSDDTEVNKGSLDLAIKILEENSDIGMVGLKMRDTIGSLARSPYLGGISEVGILNCNHGVLRYKLLKSLGYFNESYRSYTIDPDLTASVLSAGKKVVMTKQISVFHHREWSLSKSRAEYAKEQMGSINNTKIYNNKFRFLMKKRGLLDYIYNFLTRLLLDTLFYAAGKNTKRLGGNKRDWYNILHCRFIKLTDNFDNRNNPYHLVQQIPKEILKDRRSPYREIAI